MAGSGTTLKWSLKVLQSQHVRGSLEVLFATVGNHKLHFGNSRSVANSTITGCLLGNDMGENYYFNLIAGMIIYIQTEIENRKRPNIKVRPLVSDRAAVLEVFNKGGISQFRVLAKIMRNHSRGPAITLCWEPGGNKSEIERDGSGTIIVAYQFGVGLLNTPTMTSEGKKHLTIAAWPLDKWGEPQTDLPPDDVYLEISITADKNLRKTFSRMIFKLTQTSFTNLHFEYVKSESRKLKIEKDGFLK
jgi:hypothetical protein